MGEEAIVPVIKKGEGKDVNHYRGSTVMPTLYKVYAMVLAKRLREEVKRKNVIPQNQGGFRRGIGTLDNIFVLNYLANKQLQSKGGKLVALFVDLR